MSVADWKRRSLSQENLAYECNVDRSYISMIEVGRNEPSVTKI
ncbi:helix-turn-helix domain-containing protein [Paenibacillus borealis]